MWGQLCAVGSAPGWVAGIPDQVIKGQRVPPGQLAVVHPISTTGFSLSLYPTDQVHNWSVLAPNESLSGACHVNGAHSSILCECHECYQRALQRVEKISLREGGMYWCLTADNDKLQPAYLHPDAYNPDPYVCEFKYTTCIAVCDRCCR